MLEFIGLIVMIYVCILLSPIIIGLFIAAFCFFMGGLVWLKEKILG